MSIQYKIPKNSRLIQAQATATAVFNVPAIGKYDFSPNTGLLISAIFPNHLYFLERVNIGGDIAEADFQDAIDTVPVARYRTSVENAIVFPQPLPIVNYVINQELNTFIWTEKSNDNLILDVYGILNQTPALVGVTDVRLLMSFNLYDITDTGYIAEYKGAATQQNIGAAVPVVKASNSYWSKD
jgi:hypothetical protein